MKALVVLSGGQDSVTCLYWAKKHYEEVIAITFNYGQRHRIELESAIKTASLANVEHETINVKGTLEGTSPLVNFNFEVEQYKDAESLPGGLEKTFVPSRNMLFLTIASNRAYVHECDFIVTGVSQEDFGGYPDCRETFIRSMEMTINKGLDKDIRIITPLINLTKKETVELAYSLGEDCWDALSYSHTCYNGHYPPCGNCHSCLLREKGFKEAGLADPLIARSSQYL